MELATVASVKKLQRLRMDADRRIRALFVILGFACVAAIGLSLSKVIDSSIIAPAGAVLAASVAALTALRINESFEERRLRTLRAQRKEASEQLIAHLVMQFAGGADGGAAREAQVRAAVALWGSRELMSLLRQWHEKIAALPASGAVEPDTREQYQLLVARIALTARADVALSDGVPLIESDIAGVIFNDFSPNARA